ncbi:MAG: C39 family peptidase [Clostridiales bacterium]|nr:C39 family peptidase [Clostridiales bacterium]
MIILIAAAAGFAYHYFKPDDTVFLRVAEYNQYPDYPTGCESASLYMLLQYYDVDVTMEEIVEELPKGPLPYEADGQLYGANPEKEFVGDPKDANSYGVFNEPIRETAEVFKSGAISKTSATIEDIEKIIKSGNPVIAWYTTNLESGIEYRREWLDYETGETVRWPSYEHAVVIYGISDDNIFYNDPNTGTGNSMSRDVFKISFEEMGGRIVYYD